MDLFDVIISPKALSQLNDYIDYLRYTLLNEQAAYNVWQDALQTRNQLSKVADSLKFCTSPQLKKKWIPHHSFHAAPLSYALPDRGHNRLCGCHIPSAPGLRKYFCR